MTSQPLSQYDESQLRGLELLKVHVETLSVSYMHVAKAIENLRDLHDLYHKNPSLRSRELMYRAAIQQYEAARSAVTETKALAYEAGIAEWVP
jgi:hypothetical protein